MIVIRHAKPVLDDGVPPADWELSEQGRAAAAALGAELGMHAPVRTSTERKAIATGQALGLGAVTASDGLREVTRPWYGDADGLETHVRRWFTGEVLDGWERMTDAVARFDAAVADDPPVIVTHGTVLTAWLHARGLVEDAFTFWHDLRMPDAWKVGPTLTRCLPPS